MTEVVELVPGRLFRLGGRVPLDGSITWAPDGATGYEPLNVYLLLSGTSALLVDTGPRILSEQIIGQLESVLPEGAELTVFVTRMEGDCVTGLGEIGRHFKVAAVCTGGTSNPFDYFDGLNSSEMMRASYRAELRRWLPGEQLVVGGNRPLDVVIPPLRLLFTSWAYDGETGTLFTSDAFAHVSVASEHADPVVLGGSDTTTPDDVRHHLLKKFSYLEGARTSSIIEQLDELFKGLRVERIAPTHGCVLGDKAVCDNHLDMVKTVLAKLDSST